MIYLDTHIVVWLYLKDQSKFSPQSQALLNQGELYISPIVQLELQYLYEIGRLTITGTEIVTHLAQQIDLKLCEKSFAAIVSRPLSETWTRDPFDRLIVANAALHNDLLITKDANILNHYPLARW